VADRSGDGFLTAAPTVRLPGEEARMIAGCAGGSLTQPGWEANLTASLDHQRWGNQSDWMAAAASRVAMPLILVT
jgi:hypothetical protein